MWPNMEIHLLLICETEQTGGYFPTEPFVVGWMINWGDSIFTWWEFRTVQMNCFPATLFAAPSPAQRPPAQRVATELHLPAYYQKKVLFSNHTGLQAQTWQRWETPIAKVTIQPNESVPLQGAPTSRPPWQPQRALGGTAALPETGNSQT